MYPTQENSSHSTVNWSDATKLPNLVSIARLLLCVPIAIWALQPGWQGVLGFWLFVLAAGTDKLDGWLAKRNNGALMTKLGAMLDPTIDKLLTVVTLIVVIVRGEEWLRPHAVLVFLLLLVREVVVLRTRLGQRVESASEAGRFSMVVTCIAVGVTLLPAVSLDAGDLHIQWTRSGATIVPLLYFALGASLCSGWSYWAAWRKAQRNRTPQPIPSTPESQG